MPVFYWSSRQSYRAGIEPMTYRSRSRLFCQRKKCSSSSRGREIFEAHVLGRQPVKAGNYRLADWFLNRDVFRRCAVWNGRRTDSIWRRAATITSCWYGRPAPAAARPASCNQCRPTRNISPQWRRLRGPRISTGFWLREGAPQIGGWCYVLRERRWLVAKNFCFCAVLE